VRVHSQAAADALKRGAIRNDLFDRIAADRLFGMDAATIEGMADPAAYTGLARQQTERFVIEEIDPLLDREREHIHTEAGEVRV
jgi:adenylosuccinate lyase